MDKSKMHFVLTGFTEEAGFRVFAFEGVGGDWARTPFTVRIDLALSRRYGIRLQELPLLCRALLDNCDVAEPKHSFVFTEQDMCLYADRAAARAEAAKQRKLPRKPVSANVGAAWRAPQG